MEITHEVLETMLKQLADKLKFQLCLKFSNDDYSVALSDGLPSDSLIQAGDTVTIKIKTQKFVDVITRKASGNEFRQLLELCLRNVPRMQVTLTHQPVADILLHNPETDKLKRYTKKQFEKEFPPHPYEKEIHFSNDSRTTAIHWKSGIVIREFGKSVEDSYNKARRKILSLLQDPEIYNRTESSFEIVENHEDVIYDIVVGAKLLNKDEVRALINQLNERYLK